jgi:uncharacterized protein (TIGR02569 family)
MAPGRPSSEVLDAFGVTGPPVALAGGRASSWRAGNVVLKALDTDEDELAWRADTFARIACDGFRVAAPLRAAGGALVVDGWTATRLLSGRHEPRRWEDIIAAGERFHAALAGVARPGFIERRTNAWAVADRVAWGEEPADIDAEPLPRLMAALRPVHAPPQLVHGDLTGNVLFDERLPPAILDVSPYWRPPGYASAIVVGDALAWEGADATLLDAVAHIEDFPQYLLRAVIFRLVTDWILGLRDPDPYALPVELACRLAAP